MSNNIIQDLLRYDFSARCTIVMHETQKKWEKRIQTKLYPETDSNLVKEFYKKD